MDRGLKRVLPHSETHGEEGSGPRTTFGVRFPTRKRFPGDAKSAYPGLSSIHASGVCSPEGRGVGNYLGQFGLYEGVDDFNFPLTGDATQTYIGLPRL
jgi:hypothetical protein